MFLKNEEAFEIVREFGSPVYVYSEDILRQRCRELLDAFEGRLSPSFSVKANSNLSLLRIIREEGIDRRTCAGGRRARGGAFGDAPGGL